eukprot:5928613-Pleurochrysis_carterae.AAC.1
MADLLSIASEVGTARVSQIRKESSEVDRLFGGLACGHDLGLARREGHGGLFFGRPGDRGAVVGKDVTGSGMTRGPVGVGVTTQAVGARVLVPKADRLVMV